MTNRTQPRFFLLLLAAALAGCSPDSIPVSPTEPPPPPPPPEVGIELAGIVADAVWRPLVGARVEVVGGPHSGRFATTDSRGAFRLKGDFDSTTHFRATMNGYQEVTSPLPASCAVCSPNWWLHFHLETDGAHADLAGEYTLTLTADSTCTGLPIEARTRTYDATVTPVPAASRSQFNVELRGSTFVETLAGFVIGVVGDYVHSDIGGHGGPGIVERVADSTYVTIDAALKASLPDASTISGSLSGVVSHCELPTAWGVRYSCSSAAVVSLAECTSQRHQLVLKRR